MASGESCSGSKTNDDVPVKVLAFDFDKTCTKRMILDIYKAREDYQNDDGLRKILDEEWERLEKLYSVLISAKGLSLVSKPSPVGQFDEVGLRRFLNEVQAIDSLAADRLIESNILRGLTAPGIRDFAEKVELMPDLLHVLKTLNQVLHLPFHVISLNLSKKLIMDALNRASTPLPFDVHSNELEFKNGICTGNMDKKFVSAFDKEVQLVKIIENAGRDGVTIFIGDSLNDLLALLKADIGIVIGDSKSMLNVCNNFGIYIVPLCQWNYSMLSENNSESQPVLFSVKSWDEIKNFACLLTNKNY